VPHFRASCSEARLPPAGAGRFSVQQALSAVTQTAKELGRLHRQCVIHCDIKPANLHQSEDDVWRLLDLGVALHGR